MRNIIVKITNYKKTILELLFLPLNVLTSAATGASVTSGTAITAVTQIKS